MEEHLQESMLAGHCGRWRPAPPRREGGEHWQVHRSKQESFLMGKVLSRLSLPSRERRQRHGLPTKGLAWRASRAYTLPTLEWHDSNNKKTLTLHCRHRFREASLCASLARRAVSCARPGRHPPKPLPCGLYRVPRLTDATATSRTRAGLWPDVPERQGAL